MTKTAELLKLELSLAQLQQDAPDTEDTDAGDEGRSGSGGVVVEKELFVEVFGMIRHGEKQFGFAPDFDQLAYLNKDKGQFHDLANDNQSSLKSHPILSQLSKFDGDTPNMSIDPTRNPDAQERYENKLRLRLAAQNRNQHIATPKPRGM